jgi:AraC family transcriptional regulator of arabinose operon
MLYAFEPFTRRKVTEVNYNYHKVPQLHMTRRLRVHDMFYVIDGFCSFAIGDEEFEVYPGDVAVLPGGIEHRGAKPFRAETRTIYAHFTGCMDDSNVKKENEGIEHLVTGGVVHNAGPVVLHYFEDLRRLFWKRRPYREERLSALVNLLLSELADRHRQNMRGENHIIRRLIETMDKEPDRFFSVGELAEIAGMSRRSLEGAFKNDTKKTVHQYQTDSKLEKVAVLLKSESYTSLARLAEDFGFSSEFHLSERFKKKYGMGPKDYRRHNEHIEFDDAQARITESVQFHQIFA